jgi:DNA-binding GntR family transcriptional regulator
MKDTPLPMNPADYPLGGNRVRRACEDKETPMDHEVSTARTPDLVGEVRRRVIAGELPPGSRVEEAGLAADLGAGNEEVREALDELAAEGLVENGPDQARQVAVVDELHAVQLLDVLEVVLVAVFERAAPRVDAAGVAAMEASAAELEAALDAGDLAASREPLLELIRIILDAAEHDELRAVNEYVMQRSMGRLYLHRRSEFYFLWSEGWKETVALLKADEPDAAVQRLRRMFWIVTEELRGGGPLRSGSKGSA